jgi:hypothetical protein
MLLPYFVDFAAVSCGEIGPKKLMVMQFECYLEEGW